MTNIVKTNNQQLRLAPLSVGLLSTLRIALPMVPQSATNVEVIVTSGDTHNAYTATFDSTKNWWLCDIDASQFPNVGRQKYEVAYKISGDQFWDGQGWIEIVNATTSGITPAPLPDPYRYVVVTINGYGAMTADGAVRIPKLNIGTEDPSETTGYIEGDQYFNRNSGEQWVLCSVTGTLTWVKCDSGVTSVNGKVGAVSLGANDVGAYTKSETDAALANKLDKTAVVAPSASATAGQAADAKATHEALAGKVNNVDGVIENQLIVGPDEDCTVIAGGKVNHGYYDGIGVYLATIKLPNKNGTFAIVSDIEDAVKGKVGSFESVGGASATVENGVAKLSDFFTESNSLLNGRLSYSRNATGLKDRAFNTLSFDGTEFNLSTALAAVTPTASGQPRDLLIVATATAATTISFTAGTIKGDKPTIDGSGTWLITLTEYAANTWYCRQIKMEDAA